VLTFLVLFSLHPDRSVLHSPIRVPTPSLSTFNCDLLTSFSLTFQPSNAHFASRMHLRDLPTCQRFLTYLLSFQTLLHPRKTQLSCFQVIPNSFAKTPGGGVPPRFSRRIKMNQKTVNSNSINDSPRCHQRTRSDREVPPSLRFVSQPYNCLVNYIDSIFPSADPAGHFPHSTQRSGSRA
jgi:hypothetical protein